jgi:hypothetical protein
MMSRDEVKNKLAKTASDAMFIDEFFDSIGSCGECKHSYYDTGMIKDELLCSRGSFNPIEEDFFCADFEHK